MPEGLYVQDFSTNGTYRNDRRIDKGQKVLLRHGDVIACVRARYAWPSDAPSSSRVYVRAFFKLRIQCIRACSTLYICIFARRLPS